jgi:hypothetical protein
MAVPAVFGRGKLEREFEETNLIREPGGKAGLATGSG